MIRRTLTAGLEVEAEVSVQEKKAYLHTYGSVCTKEGEMHAIAHGYQIK